MTGTDVIRDYLQAHPGECVDTEAALGRVWTWNAARLRSEARAIMETLGLPGSLSRFGQAGIVGSVATDLLVKLDIDVHVLVRDPDLYQAMNPIYRMFLDRDDVRHVRISDYRSNGGLKLGIDAYAGPSGDWSIDIMATDRVERTGFALVERINREMTPEQRLATLTIKGDYFSRGELEGGMSRRIYDAVLDHGVMTIDEFKQHLAGNGK